MSSDGGTARLARLAGGGAVGAGTAVALVAAGVAWPVGTAVGIGLFAGVSVVGRRRRGQRPERIDAFSLGEPWRLFVLDVQKAERRLLLTIADVDDGPLRDRLDTVAARLDHARRETWRIARHGDQLDDARRRLDPTALRSRRAAILADDTIDRTAELASVDSQLATADRLRERSERTANVLRGTTSRYDELVARATEVAVGSGDAEGYAHDVDDLVIELEGLRLAAQEVDEITRDTGTDGRPIENPGSVDPDTGSRGRDDPDTGSRGRDDTDRGGRS